MLKQVQNYALVFLGSGLGGILRYFLSGFVYNFLPENFPYGTLTVNVLGSFIIGFVMYGLFQNDIISTQARIFLTIGLCGGLTTFSTFSYETINLLKEREYYFAFINILLNLILTLLVLFISYKFSKYIFR